MKIRSEDGLADEGSVDHNVPFVIFVVVSFCECNTHPAMHGGGSGGG